jgi:hypothetical protein
VRRSSPLLSFTVAGSLICAPIFALPCAWPTLAHAGNLSFAPAEAAEDPALTEAKSLYKEGEVKFQTADYEEALALWKKAFAMLPDGEETRAIRHALVYNIAEAHRRAYEVSRNPTHLRKAKILLENYRADHRNLYGDEPEAVKERSEVDDRIAELDKMIADSEAAGETATPLTGDAGADGGTNTTGDTGTAPPPTPQPQPKPLSPKQQWERDVKADPVLGPKWEKANKRIVGGAVMAGIGIPFVAVSIALIFPAVQPVDPDAVFTGKGLLWTGVAVTGVIGLGLLIPGGVLLGTGIGARKQVLQAKPKPTGFLTPMPLRRGGGLGYTIRF